MTIDLSEFRQPVKRQCKVGKFAETLTPDDREKFLAALNEPDIDSMSIYRWMDERGATFTYSPLLIHRKRNCSCPI